MFYAYAFLGPANPWAGAVNLAIEKNIYANPLAVFFSGTFAVAIFFVISGFVLSIGFFETGKSIILKKLAAKRYIRLMIPALTSVIIVWLILALGLSHVQATAAITHSGWLASMWTFVPNLFDAIGQGVWGIFTTDANYYNPVLWTMLYEFSGSFIIFGTLLLFGKTSKRFVIYVALLIAFFQTWYIGFIIGMILADLYVSKRFPFDRPRTALIAISLVLGLLLGSYPIGSILNTPYETFTLPWLSALQNHSLLMSIGAGIVVVSVIQLPKLSKFMSLPLIAKLGKYTFSLYLIHKPILFTLCAGIFVWLVQDLHFSLNKAAFTAIALSIPGIIIATFLFERYIDMPAIRFSGVVANWLLGLPQKEGVTAYSDHVYKVSLIRRIQTIFLRSRNKFKRSQKPMVVRETEN